ncbi:MAG: hypothetical protein GXP55_17645 [Deltaproteobacteria bacterium]|nr:hypothetical protein [Deltaproteobacteria bacterium]
MPSRPQTSQALFALLLTSLLMPARAHADMLVLSHEFTADEAHAAGGRLGRQGDVEWLAVRGGRDRPRRLLSLEVPTCPHAVVELRGNVRGRDISPAAQLVLWLDYGEGHRYRVATDGAGATAALEGSFESRPFRIPYAGREGDTLRRIELELELPGRGVVAISPLRLVALDQRGLPARMRPWFAGTDVDPLFGPVGLGLLGCALFVGLLAIVGRLRDLALSILRLVSLAGLLLMGAGGFGMSQSQPAAVTLPLLGAGGIALVFALLLYGPTARRFRTAEIKRLPHPPRAH